MRLPCRIVYEEGGFYSIEIWFLIWWGVMGSFTTDKEKALKYHENYLKFGSIHAKRVVKL